MDNLYEDHALYGKIAHKILEDSVISADNLAAAESHHLLHLLTPAQKTRMTKSLKRLSESRELQNILQGKILTEQPVGRLLDGGESKIGRIDLLVIQSSLLYIIDYKTDKKPPKDQFEINPAYRQQLISYQNILSQIYPHHKIITKILWVESAKLMDVV